MTIDKTQLVTYAPAAAAVVIVALGWTLLVRPVSSAASRDARTLAQLRQRATAVRASLSQPLPPREVADPADAFRRDVAARDAVPQLMEQLARLASTAGASNLTIETGERGVVPVGSPSGPQVAGANQPDPRLALFETPLAYMPITMAFDADYAHLGDLLWHLRAMPTLVEVRSLEVKPLPDHAPVTLHAMLTLFAYGRQGSGAPAPAVVRASNGPGVGQ